VIWKTVKLGELLDIQNGYAFNSKKFASDGDMPLIRIRDLKNAMTTKTFYTGDYDDKYIINSGDLLVGMDGEFRCYEWKGEPALQNQRVCKLQNFHNDLNQYFLLYVINGELKKIEDVTGFTTVKHLSSKTIRDIELKLPPLAEQERIVAKLDAAFAEIDESIKNINLKEIKLDKFKSAIISDSYRGNGWDNERLGDCVSYEKNNAKGSSLPYVGMENIAPETMDLVGEIVIPKKTSSTFHFNKSHVLFGRLRPYLRKVLVPDFEGQCSTEIFCIKPKDKVIREFLAYWLLEQKISSKIEATSTGARMPRANMNALLEFDFPIPSTKEQKKIISKIDLIFTKIREAKNTLAKSKTNYFALKSAILSQELQSSKAA